jgi:hypothetical protein
MMRDRLSDNAIHYPHPHAAHPLIGRRMVDVDRSGKRLYS